MRRFRSPFVLSLAAVVFWVSGSGAVAPAPQTVPAYQQFLSPASPLEVVAARNVDRIAWTSFQEGMRNAYTAAAPAFTPRRLTNFLKTTASISPTYRFRTTAARSFFSVGRRRTGSAGPPIRPPILQVPNDRYGPHALPAALRGVS